jgi:hypothetical protein
MNANAVQSALMPDRETFLLPYDWSRLRVLELGTHDEPTRMTRLRRNLSRHPVVAVLVLLVIHNT